MLVLAIDTSSAAVTAAVVDVDGVVLAEVVTINNRGHGEYLAPAIAACLAESGATPRDLGAVVVGTGPGPFTGLRVGLVTAAVMAELLAIPAYGVCSLDAIGAACAEEPQLLVATDARRHEVYWARYAEGLPTSGPAVNRPADVPVDGLSAVAGQGVELYDFAVPRRAERYPSGLALVSCAADRIRSAAPSEPLTPLYLRRPDAVVPGTAKPVTQ